MKIEQCNIGQDVVMGKDGIEGKIIGIWPDQVRVAVFGGIRYASPDSIDPVSDPCQSCEMAATITNQCNQIAELQTERDGWKSAAEAYSSLKDDYRARLAESRRNAAYWREELEKLQKEALAEYRPLGDVAKIYLRISPEELDRILQESD